MGGAVAMLGFASSHSIDLYAIWDQLNVVVADVTKLVAMVTPLATAAYGVYRTSTAKRMEDLAKNPDVKGIITTPKLADAVDSNKVVASNAELPTEAKQ